MAKCKHCGKNIWWATHQTTGKTAPLDADPSTDGNCLTFESGGKLYYCIPPEEDRADLAGKLRRNHWSTCKSPPVRKAGATA